MKPMLASDYDEQKLRFPLLAQPKVDGVRGLNLTGSLTGRSLKPHANKYTTKFFSHSAFLGLDGELAAQHECHPDLCRLTTSALNRIDGEPFTLWWLFDYIVPGQTKALPYVERFWALQHRHQQLLREEPELAARVRLIPVVECGTLEQLLEVDAQWLEAGYEGTIIRDPAGLYKEGRSTVREGGLLRIKRFVEEEAIVEAIEEGQTNTNVAQQNELGLQYRTTHAEGMVPNGQVGALLCRTVKDGTLITVAAGRMPVENRVHYFQNQQALIGQVIKYKHFPKGVKDKPRFPTFQTLRAASDI
jgi:DNA ligase 1